MSGGEECVASPEVEGAIRGERGLDQSDPSQARSDGDKSDGARIHSPNHPPTLAQAKRWQRLPLGGYVGTDPSSSSLAEARERWRPRKPKADPFSVEFVQQVRL